MTYRLVYTARALKDIERLDPQVKSRLGRAIRKFAKDPLRHAEKIHDFRLGEYRFRIGAYRVIFDLVEKDIVVLRVGHRREIYRR